MAINPLIIHQIKRMIPCYKGHDKRNTFVLLHLRCTKNHSGSRSRFALKTSSLSNFIVSACRRKCNTFIESSDQGLWFFFLTPRSFKQFIRTLWLKNLKFHRLWEIIAFSLHHKAKAHEFSSILALPPPPLNPPFKKSTFKKREVKLLFTACL